MKKLLPILLLALSLGGCAQLTNAWNVVTGSSVNPEAVYIAENAFDTVEATATNYLIYCKTHRSQSVCAQSAINQVIPAVRAGRVARTNLDQFMKDNPGALGPSGLYNALTAATATLKAILAQYSIS